MATTASGTTVATAGACAAALSIVPELPLPCFYEKDFSYSDQWNRYKAAVERDQPENGVVFDLAWWRTEGGSIGSGNDDKDDRLYVVACTGCGEIVIWRAPPSSMDEELEEEDDGGGAGRSDSDRRDNNNHNHAAAAAAASASRDRSRAIYRQKVSDGVLYALKIFGGSSLSTSGSTEDRRASSLVVAGDEGVLLFNWERDFLEPALLAEGVIEGHHGGDRGEQRPSPLAIFRPHPSAFEDTIEVNDVLVHENHLYAAAGDAFGCYKWDLEKQSLVATYGGRDIDGARYSAMACGGGFRRGGYLHSIDVVPNSNLLLAGGEDGVLQLWDCVKDRIVECIDMETAAATASSSLSALTTTTTTTNTAAAASTSRSNSPVPAGRPQTPPPMYHQTSPRGNKRQNTGTARYNISSVAALDENWWTVAGGVGASGPAGKTTSGYLSTWHAATRSMIALAETRERPQKVLRYCEQQPRKEHDNRGVDGGSVADVRWLLSLANEPVVSFWDPLTLQRARRVPMMVDDGFCSGYAAAAAPGGGGWSNGRVAVAGVGNSVALLEHGGSVVAFQFQLGTDT